MQPPVFCVTPHQPHSSPTQLCCMILYMLPITVSAWSVAWSCTHCPSQSQQWCLSMTSEVAYDALLPLCLVVCFCGLLPLPRGNLISGIAEEDERWRSPSHSDLHVGQLNSSCLLVNNQEGVKCHTTATSLDYTRFFWVCLLFVHIQTFLLLGSLWQLCRITTYLCCQF